MSIDTPADQLGMERVGRLVAEVLAELRDAVRPGITTGALDAIAARRFRQAGATSGPMDLVGFPATICISVNEEVVHGVPGGRVLREGDLVTLDVTPLLDGFCADAAITVAVGRPAPAAAALLRTADACLTAAVNAARRGGATVYEELQGHGVGRTMHEPPEVPNVFSPRHRKRLTEGLVLAIEPMIGLGRPDLVVREDGWTIATADGSLSAHVEHTVAVRRGGGEILTV